MTRLDKILDNKYVRRLPDINCHGFVINRTGWNFRPDWDPSLKQPWYGKWWLWIGPYLIGWPKDWV